MHDTAQREIEADVIARCRITSYNVCYTKLLRYVTVLREAIDTDTRTPCGVYFGTSGGQLFASADAGGSWRQVAGYLPRVLSVRALESS